MSQTRTNTSSAQSFFLSVIYWAFVYLITAVWQPVWHLMSPIIKMRSEYSLLEQGTNFLLLLMLVASLIVYRNEEETARIKLSMTFILFAVILYLSESNFIDSAWRPLFVAALLLALIWKLSKIDLLALLMVFCGLAVLVVGILGDVWDDHPDLLPVWALSYGEIAHPLEEYADLWGVAFFTYACFIVFRKTLTQFFLSNRVSLFVLVFSVGLVASGNSFAHWEYGPGRTTKMAATAMAFLGFAGVSLVHEKLSNSLMPFGLFDRSVFYSNFTLLFLVLPVIYGGVYGALNVIMWLCYFALAGAYLYRSNTRLSQPT